VATVADDADRAALERIARDELGALDDLYERYKTMAYSIAYRITNDATLAEDVVQEAFLGVWRNAARYVEGRGSVKTWLLSIVHHRAIDAVRRRRATVELPERDDARRHALRLPDVWAEVSSEPRRGRGPCRARGADRRAARGDRARLLRRADPGRDRRTHGYALGTVKSRMRLGSARDAEGALAMTDARRPGGLPGGAQL
jgi:RNA polymerase sigma-70 factor (ECF subfamily)